MGWWALADPGLTLKSCPAGVSLFGAISLSPPQPRLQLGSVWWPESLLSLTLQLGILKH